MPAGRPSKYKKKFCQDIIDHMAQGGHVESFGAYLADKYEKDKTGRPMKAKLRISKVTVYAWAKAHPEFLNAKAYGEALAMKYWMNIGVTGMTGNLKRLARETPALGPDKKTPLYDKNGKLLTIKEYEPTTFGQSAWIFLMKNCFHWRDRTDITSGDKPVSFAMLAQQAAEEDGGDAE